MHEARAGREGKPSGWETVSTTSDTYPFHLEIIYAYHPKMLVMLLYNVVTKRKSKKKRK